MQKLLFLLLIPFFAIGQANGQLSEYNSKGVPSATEMVSMNDVKVNYGAPFGQRYYEKGSSSPYTGWLSARYDNGKLESISQYKDGYGNGLWMNFDPDGNIESQGTLVNNKTIGPAKLFYEDGSVKASGEYVHVKNKVGWWYFYNRQGKVVSKRFFTK
jgi:antitoxin component YwqK of YwqJK toxin-antitoxin module